MRERNHRSSMLVIVIAAISAACGGSPASPAGTQRTSSNTFSIYGQLYGVAYAGITITVAGPVTASTVSDAKGKYQIDGLPYGDYTVTPSSASDITFSPPWFVLKKDFAEYPSPSVQRSFSTLPHSALFTETIAGDAASGVQTGTYTNTVLPETNQQVTGGGRGNNPDVMVYDSARDQATFIFRHYDSLPDMGGWVQIAGRPAVGTYSNVPTASFQQVDAICLQEQLEITAGRMDGSAYWMGDQFSIALTSVTEFQTNEPGITYYSVHGTFHVNCPAYVATAADPLNGYARGNVTVDIAF